MNPADFRLKKTIEAILVRNYVDTQKTEVDVVAGNVYLDGEFDVAETNVNQEQLGELIEGHYEARRVLLAIEQQIRAIGEVNGLYFNFKNWAKSGTGWAPKTK